MDNIEKRGKELPNKNEGKIKEKVPKEGAEAEKGKERAPEELAQFVEDITRAMGDRLSEIKINGNEIIIEVVATLF